jgi:hypothetical protein
MSIILIILRQLKLQITVNKVALGRGGFCCVGPNPKRPYYCHKMTGYLCDWFQFTEKAVKAAGPAVPRPAFWAGPATSTVNTVRKY